MVIYFIVKLLRLFCKWGSILLGGVTPYVGNTLLINRGSLNSETQKDSLYYRCYDQTNDRY